MTEKEKREPNTEQSEKTQSRPLPPELTHINADGRAKMVDVGEKEESLREASAETVVKMKPETLALIKKKGVKKGDVISIAQVAGIMGAKRTSELIPMCHPIAITGADFDFKINESESTITIQAIVRTVGRTGVEMEALTAVATAALTIYDMCKAVDKNMVIDGISLIEKSGGRSGVWKRDHA